MFNFCDFIQVFVFTTNDHLKTLEICQLNVKPEKFKFITNIYMVHMTRINIKKH